MSFTGRIVETGTGFTQEENGQWQLVPTGGSGGSPSQVDLYYIKTRNTGTQQVEVHVAPAQNNWQQVTRHLPTTFAVEENGTWMIGNFANPQDLIYIKNRNVPTNQVEIHVASSTSNYQTRIFEETTGFTAEDNGTWTMIDWFGTSKLDLVYIKTRNTGSGTIEVHVASASSNYQSIQHFTSYFSVNDGSNGTWLMHQMQPGEGPDLVFLKLQNSGTNTVEVHCVTAASEYKQPRIQTGTTFAQEDYGMWALIDYKYVESGHQAPLGDLSYLKTAMTGTGKTEIHIAAR